MGSSNYPQTCLVIRWFHQIITKHVSSICGFVQACNVCGAFTMKSSIWKHKFTAYQAFRSDMWQLKTSEKEICHKKGNKQKGKKYFPAYHCFDMWKLEITEKKSMIIEIGIRWIKKKIDNHWISAFFWCSEITGEKIISITLHWRIKNQYVVGLMQRDVTHCQHAGVVFLSH